MVKLKFVAVDEHAGVMLGEIFELKLFRRTLDLLSALQQFSVEKLEILTFGAKNRL